MGPHIRLPGLVCSCLISFLTGSVLPAPAADSDKTSIKALQLKQRHYFFGTTELTLSKSAAKLECTGQMKFVIITRAPSWTVTLYRTDDKTYFDESMAMFTDTGAVSGYILSYREKYILEAAKPSTIKVSGFEAIKLLDKSAEFVYLPDDHTLPAKVHDFVYAAYKLPTCGGVPLRYVRVAKGKDMITQMDETGKNQLMISTTLIKNVSVPPSFFELPKGLHKATSVRNIVLSESKREESADFQVMFDGSDRHK